MYNAKHGISPGSFDPVHNGHIELAKQHANHVGKLTMGIGINPDKHSGVFHYYERAEMLKDALLDLPEHISKKIDIDFVRGLIVDYCTEKGIKYIFKSYRNDQDYTDELKQAMYNKAINPDIETRLVGVSSDNEYGYVSSSGEKIFMKLGANQTALHTTLRVKHALETRLNQQYIVGMTGEVGSGKSYTGEQFVRLGEEFGIPTHNIDFDRLGHNILQKSENYNHIREEIKEVFGLQVMDTDGSIHRGELGKIVFRDPHKLTQLNMLMKQALEVEYRKALAGKTGIIIVNAALLADHDMGNHTNNNAVIVGVDRKIQIERILARNNTSEAIAKRGYEFTTEDAEQILKRQLSESEKKTYFATKQEEKRYGKSVLFDNTTPTDNAIRKAFFETVDAVDNDMSLRFSSLCTRLKLTGDTKKLFQDVYFTYLQNNLPYHNWQHIRYGLNQIYMLRDKFQRPDLVEMARFFHDIIYQVPSGNTSNEILSAQLAKDTLTKYGLSPQEVGYVYKLIVATEHKGNSSYSDDEMLMMDIDMSIMASSHEQYLRYTQAVRQEYAIYPDNTYRKGRLDFLKGIKRIFYSTEFTPLEEIAHANISSEIAFLEK